MEQKIRRTRTVEEVGYKHLCYSCDGDGKQHKFEYIWEELIPPISSSTTQAVYRMELGPTDAPCWRCDGTGYIVEWEEAE